MNKKGVSDVIATILIILLVLAAVIIVWQVVSKVVKGGAGTVEQKAQCIDASLDLTNVVCNGSTTNVTGSISRGADNADITAMKIILGNKIYDITASAEIPIALTTESFNKACDPTTDCEIADVITVKVAPVIGVDKIICDPTDELSVTCVS